MSVFAPSYGNIGSVNATFLSALVRGTDEDKVVVISANNTVAVAASTNQFMGVAKVIDEADAAATVQTHGFVTVAYTSTAPTIGLYTLEADASGGIQIVATPALGDIFYRIVAVDTTASTVTFIIG